MTNETKSLALPSWVLARAKCSLPQVFKELAQGVEGDVRDAKSLEHKHSRRAYSFAQISNDKFSVNRCDDPVIIETYDSVDFEILDNEIVVTSMIRNSGKAEVLRSKLTLNNDGQCRLLVNGQELEQWQVRRKALESLFFK